MSWKAWGYYSVAIIATLLACWLWLVVLGESRDASLGSAVSGARNDAAANRAVIPVRVAPPAPRRTQEACVAGVKWFYDEDRQRWFKPLQANNGLPLPCQLGTVRSENDREGLIVRYPKGWHPNDR